MRTLFSSLVCSVIILSTASLAYAQLKFACDVCYGEGEDATLLAGAYAKFAVVTPTPDATSLDKRGGGDPWAFTLHVDTTGHVCEVGRPKTNVNPDERTWRLLADTLRTWTFRPLKTKADGHPVCVRVKIFAYSRISEGRLVIDIPYFTSNSAKQ